MSKRVRLPSERQLKAIKDNALHEAIVADLADEVARALEALNTAIPGTTLTLDVATSTLSGLLRAQDGVRALVNEVANLGGSALDEDELLLAMANWIIDNQLGSGFEWDGSIPPARH